MRTKLLMLTRSADEKSVFVTQAIGPQGDRALRLAPSVAAQAGAAVVAKMCEEAVKARCAPLLALASVDDVAPRNTTDRSREPMPRARR